MKGLADDLPIPDPAPQGHWRYAIRILRATLANEAHAWFVDRERADVRFGVGQAGVAHGVAATWNDAVRDAVSAREWLMKQNRDNDAE